MKKLKVDYVAAEVLKERDLHPRKATRAVAAVVRSIQRFGFNVPILCNWDHVLIAGHTRLLAARKLGIKEVPVIHLGLDTWEEAAFSIADNKTAEIAEWDWGALRRILESLRDEDMELSSLGFTDFELRDILGADDEEDWVPGLSTNAVTSRGDLIRLRKHRITCGDSAEDGILASLSSDMKVDMVFAGPPCFNQCGLGAWTNYASYSRAMNRVIQNCSRLMRDGGIFVWHIANDSARHLNMLAHHSAYLEAAGLEYLDILVWKKSTANYASPRNVQIKRNGYYLPATQWEALAVYQKPGKMTRMSEDARVYMARHHTNVWELPNPTNQVRDYGHPATCPLEIPFRCIQAYTEVSGLVLDPFGGSGTTLIAAEKTGRIAFLCEFRPEFCDAAVSRWERWTGERATRVGSRTALRA